MAEAADGDEAMRRLLELKPDVALLDIAMPKLSGLAVLHQIAATGLGTRVLLLSMYDNDEYVAEAIRAGASGYSREGRRRGGAGPGLAGAGARRRLPEPGHLAQAGRGLQRRAPEPWPEPGARHRFCA